MSYNDSFLSDNDKAIFYTTKEKPDWKRIVIRKTEPVDVEPGISATKPLEIDKVFSRFIRSPYLFNCYCVQVKEDDGMSWAAETARVKAMEEIAAEASPFSIITLSRIFKNKFPLITDVIGLRQFLRLTYKNKIAKDFYSLHTISTLLACIIPIIVTLFTGLISKDIDKAGGFSNLFTWRYLVIALVTLAISLTGRYFIQRNKISLKAENITKLVEDIDNYSKQVQEGHEGIENVLKFEKLIADTASYLLTIIPKFVIIDNYKSLDFFTRQVIEKYFSLYGASSNQQSSQKECWLIFEGNDNNNFSNKKFSADKGNKVYKNITVFEIKNLSEAEKVKFVMDNHIPAENALFSHMRPICTRYEGLKWVQENLNLYRKDHPRQEFSKLEFLYLLTLTSLKERLPFSDDELYTIFEKGRIRSDILKSYMYDTYSFDSKKLINGLKNSLLEDKHLRDMIVVEKKENADPKICVTYETALVLNKDSNFYKDKQDDKFFHDLKLPNDKIGHAFWAIYWYDRLQSRHPNETFWFDQLSYHLTNFDFESLRSTHNPDKSDYSIDDILAYSMEAYIYTIGGSLRTAAFREITQLVECAVSGIRELQGNGNPNSAKFDRSKLLSLTERLLVKCWDTYICFKDNNVLKSINTLNKVIQSLEPAVSPLESYYPYCSLYFGLVANNTYKELSGTSRYGLLFTSRTNLQSVEDHIVLSSILASITVSPLLYNKTSYSSFQPVSNGGFGKTSSIIKKVTANISNTQGGASIVDMVNLSLSIWTLALQYSSMSVVITGETDQLLEAFDNMATVIQSLKRNDLHSNRKAVKNEFLLSALLTEMAAVTMASYIISSELVARTDKEREFTENANQFIRQTNELFNTKLSPISDASFFTLTSAYINGANLLLQTTSAIWNRLGFTEFGNNLGILSLRLKLLKGKKSADTMKVLLKNDMPVLIKPNVYSRFLMNILIGDAFRNIHFGYSFLFYCEALKLFEKQALSKQIMCELFMSKLCYGGLHIMPIEVSEKELLNDDYFSEKVLPEYVDGIPDGEVEYFINRIMSEKDMLDHESFQPLITRIINERIGKVQDIDKKNMLEGLLKYFSYVNRMEIENPGTAQEVLEEWRPYKANWYYAGVLLNHLIRQPSDNLIVDEAISVINERGDTDNISSYLNLSLRIARIEMSSKKVVDKQVMKYLADNIGRFESVNSVESNCNIYLILHQANDDGYKEYYGNQYFKWKKIQADEKSQEFKTNLSYGNYFLAFHTVIYDLKEILDEGIDKYIVKDTTGESLQPFVQVNGEMLLSGPFIERGTQLFFESPYISDHSLNNERAYFNNLAQTNIDLLFRFLIEINASTHFREIVSRYNNAYKEYTMPELES